MKYEREKTEAYLAITTTKNSMKIKLKENDVCDIDKNVSPK